MARTLGMIDYSQRRATQPRPSLAQAIIALPREPSSPPAPTRVPLDPKKRVKKSPKFQPQDVHAFVDGLFRDDLHAKRIMSLASGVVGVMHSASLAIHVIGQGLAQAQGLAPKHAIKQIDRLLSNEKVVLEELLPLWAGFVIAQRTELLVTLDWTEFDGDDQATLCLNLVTSHGRATPLLWKTVEKSSLKDRRNRYEFELIDRLHDMVPSGVRVTLLADRGFGDQKLYRALGDWGFDFIIRFKGNISVQLADGTEAKAQELVPASGHAKLYKDACVTKDKTRVAGVVCVHQKGMKDAWHLATSRKDLNARELVRCYARRFSTEENFRDTKDNRFGLGLSSTHIGDCDRRDRLLLLAAMAEALLTLLGAAAEQVGLDKVLKVSTTKKRTHSLFRQGLYWYGAIPTMCEEWLRPLMEAFASIVSSHQIFTSIFGAI